MSGICATHSWDFGIGANDREGVRLKLILKAVHCLKNISTKQVWMQNSSDQAAHGKRNAKKYLLAILSSSWQVRFPVKGMTTLTFRKLSPDSREKLSSVFPGGRWAAHRQDAKTRQKAGGIFKCAGELHTPWDDQLWNKALGTQK